ncbi:unnamed protein product [Caenorhabditis bovis]|uniref:Fungal lipase-type domain-containing protein n=1 Tax=Caenorhabditis bovis TaxID=2654633 RepID=A0A8S1EML3_9PELO|nr:unnamed protein product [Caenorhabditis bovis]
MSERIPATPKIGILKGSKRDAGFDDHALSSKILIANQSQSLDRSFSSVGMLLGQGVLWCLLVIGIVVADRCSDCVASGKTYCANTQQCLDDVETRCDTRIKLALNCPRSPMIAYSDELARNQIMVITTAAQNPNPQLCFDNQLPTMKVYKYREVNCSKVYDDVTCAAFTAYDVTKKAIVVSFKGAHGEHQIRELMESFMIHGTMKFFDYGRVAKMGYDSFMYLWNGGIQEDLRYLKYTYPTFELWVNGHSLGATLGIIASSFIAHIHLFEPDQMKVMVMGAGRVGDYAFADWYSNTFPYSFRIVHRDDPATRSPTVDDVHNVTMYHARFEVWYDNYMKPGDAYEVCQEADGPYCSNLSTDKPIADDHLYYFNIQLPLWGHAGCPKNISAYAQPEN